jgi:hypothetical protein
LATVEDGSAHPGIGTDYFNGFGGACPTLEWQYDFTSWLRVTEGNLVVKVGKG